MSDTPRTDAERRIVRRDRYLPTDPVSAEFARQLERELNNLYELLRVANQTSATSDSKVIRLEQELKKLKENNYDPNRPIPQKQSR